MSKKIFLVLPIFLMAAFVSPALAADNPFPNLKGRFLLQVEQKGEAWYLDPREQKRIFLGRPEDVSYLIRSRGLGISNANLEKIPVAVDATFGNDTDGDGLPDALENLLGTKKDSADSDNDGHSDKEEIQNQYNPSGSGKLPFSAKLAQKLSGKILLQVESRGEAWYVSPLNKKRYFIGRPEDAFNIIRKLGLGISNANLAKIKQFENWPQNNNAPKPVANNQIQPQQTLKQTQAEEKNTSSFAWQREEQIYASGRTNPSLAFSPLGDLWLFSADAKALSVKKRTNGETFGQDIVVAEGCQEAAPLFSGNELKMIAASSNIHSFVYSLNGSSQTWSREKYYLSTNNAGMGQERFIALSGDENNAVFSFGYNFNSGVFGVSPKIKLARKTDGQWSDNFESVDDGEPLAISKTPKETVVIGTSNISGNASGAWIRKSNSGDVYQDIRADDVFQNGQDVYLARIYSYGPDPDNKHIGFYKSSDGGSTWTPLEKIHTQADHIRSVEIAASGKTILVVWYSYSSRQKISGKLSFDGGETWGPEKIIVELPNGEKIPDNIQGRNTQIKLAGWEKGLALAVITENGGIYLKEYK